MATEAAGSAARQHAYCTGLYEAVLNTFRNSSQSLSQAKSRFETPPVRDARSRSCRSSDHLRVKLPLEPP